MTTLSKIIQHEINQQNGQISFARFMELALYHPDFGYYNTETFDIGKHGDFTTAPEISPLFSHCFAKQFLLLFDHLGTSDILELGAGTGRFAKDLLTKLDQLGVLPQRYYIYEPSIGLRKKQQAFFQTAAPDYFQRTIWLDSLPVNFIGIIIANEVLDALPVHCFHIEENSVKERCVASEKNKFIWQKTLPRMNELNEEIIKLRERYLLTAGYESEINYYLPSWIQSITNSLTQGVIFLVDYGYGQREYYHPERRQGTLTCFYQHNKHSDPLIHPGQQDITAHVDFTRVVESASENGCRLAGYTSQAAFLLVCDLMDLAAEVEKKCSPVEAINLHQAIKLLTLPTEMGERIKVMGLSKNMELPLLGFQLKDRRRDL